MAEKFLSSDLISVYPSGFRSASIDLEASRTTEASVVKSLVAPLNRKSYAKIEDDDSMTIVLGGYVFHLNDGVETLISEFDDPTNIYAYIKLSEFGEQDVLHNRLNMLVNVEANHALDVLDEDGKFKGIGFSNTQPSTSSYPIQLKVLTLVDDEWQIPLESKLIYSSSQVSNAGLSVPISQSFTTSEELKVGKLGDYLLEILRYDDSRYFNLYSCDIRLPWYGDNNGVTFNSIYWGADDYWINPNEINFQGFYFTKQGLGSTYSGGFVINAEDAPLTLGGSLTTNVNVTTKNGKLDIKSNTDLYIEKIKNDNYALGIDSNGKVTSSSLAYTYTRTADSGNTIKTISKIEQTSLGKISVTETNLPMASTALAGLVSVGAQTFEGVKTFNKKIVGNIDTADAFYSDATITLSGDVSGTASSTKGWSITTTIGDSKVLTSMIKDGNVTTAKIADGNVSSDKLGSGSVTTDKIKNDNVTEAKLASSSVTTAKIKDGNVTTAKIADGNVTEGKLASDSVVTAKIKNGNVTNAKLENSSITLGSTTCTLGSTYTTISGLSKIYSADFYATSDRRLKENFREVEFKKSILDLPIYKFDFIDGVKDQIGCVAQDLQEICPELVNEGEDGFLSIQESKLVYLLIDEVKKLKKEVEELKRGR